MSQLLRNHHIRYVIIDNKSEGVRGRRKRGGGEEQGRMDCRFAYLVRNLHYNVDSRQLIMELYVGHTTNKSRRKNFKLLEYYFCYTDQKG